MYESLYKNELGNHCEILIQYKTVLSFGLADKLKFYFSLPVLLFLLQEQCSLTVTLTSCGGGASDDDRNESALSLGNSWTL